MEKKLNSLAVYIVIALLLALCLPVVVALTVLNGTREKQISAEMKALIDEKVQIMQHSLVLPVWSLDQSDMHAVLQGAMLDRQVVSVEIRDPEEKILARMEDAQRRVGKLIARSVPLVMQQSRQDVSLGSLRLVVSDQQLQQKLAADKSFHALVLLAQAVVSLLIIGALVYRRILAPIGTLTQAADRIQAGRFDSCIVLPQQDEIGRLGRRMEAMQNSLKTLFEEQATILRNIPAGVLFVRGGQIVFANGAAQAMLRDDAVVLCTQRCERIFLDPAVMAGCVSDANSPAQGAAGEIVMLRRGDGSSFPAELHVSCVEGAGQGDQIWVVIDVSERLEAESRIDRLAFYDAVTQLPNKTLLLDRLRRDLGRQAVRGLPIVVFYMEIQWADLSQGMLRVDDADRLLAACAQRLAACVSAEQTLARLDGEHFALVCEAGSDEPDECIRFCESLAQRLTDALADAQQASLASQYALSLGINILRGQVRSAEEAVMQARLAMLQARSAGRNALRFFDPAMQARASQRSELEMALREAVAQRQFVVHYQPQVSAAGEVVGAEALVRWQHPARGMVSPALFIPVAEDMGLMEQIGQQVLERVCMDLNEWRRGGLACGLVVAINVSAQEFKLPQFVAHFRDTLAQHAVPPASFKVELTESMMVDHVDEVIARMHALKALGVSVSLDDFGTGYSSLSYLGRFPLDQLKIDQSFVRTMQDDAATASIVRSIITLGQSLGLSILAEGVETQAQRDLLLAQGCTLYQGYWYGRPMASEQFAALLAAPAALR